MALHPPTLATQLKQNTTACRVSFNWLGTRKTLDASQRAKAAETFGADKNYLSASQKLFNTKHPLYAKLTSIKNDIVGYWKGSTLPYTEDGVRLINRDKVENFSTTMQEWKERFDEAVFQLDLNLYELKAEAKNRLGDLYNDANYPDSVKSLFKVEWDFPSIDPPNYLAELAPAVYEQEKERVQARLNEAIALAESAFLQEFSELVKALHERLTPSADGQKKIFRDSAVENLTDFFSKFKALNIGSNADLDKLVNEAGELVKGIAPQELRDSKLLRQDIAKGLADLTGKLEPLLVNQPRRKIIRPNGVNGNGKPQTVNTTNAA